MNFPSVRGAACVLAHAPGLVRHGSKPSRELRTRTDGLDARLQGALRSYHDAKVAAGGEVADTVARASNIEGQLATTIQTTTMRT